MRGTSATPRLIVDLSIVGANLARVKQYCSLHGLGLRVHFKSFKCLAIASHLLQRGVYNFAVAKVGEAEILRQLGDFNIHIAYPALGPERTERIFALAAKGNLSISVESAQHLEELTNRFKGSGDRKLGISVSLDIGHGRCGLSTPSTLKYFRDTIESITEFEFIGIDAYAGPPSACSSPQFYQNAADHITDVLESHPDIRVSIGGGASLFRLHELSGITEVLAGSFLIHDLRIARQHDSDYGSVAVRVKTTVVSRPNARLAIIDAGSKALARHGIDIGRGIIFGVAEEYPEALLSQVNEEHGWLFFDEDQPVPSIGDQLSIIPVNQSLVFSNFNTLMLRSEGVESEKSIEARGLFI